MIADILSDAKFAIEECLQLIENETYHNLPDHYLDLIKNTLESMDNTRESLDQYSIIVPSLPCSRD